MVVYLHAYSVISLFTIIPGSAGIIFFEKSLIIQKFNYICVMNKDEQSKFFHAACDKIGDNDFYKPENHAAAMRIYQQVEYWYAIKCLNNGMSLKKILSSWMWPAKGCPMCYIINSKKALRCSNCSHAFPSMPFPSEKYIPPNISDKYKRIVALMTMVMGQTSFNHEICNNPEFTAHINLLSQADYSRVEKCILAGMKPKAALMILSTNWPDDVFNSAIQACSAVDLKHLAEESRRLVLIDDLDRSFINTDFFNKAAHRGGDKTTSMDTNNQQGAAPMTKADKRKRIKKIEAALEEITKHKANIAKVVNELKRPDRKCNIKFTTSNSDGFQSLYVDAIGIEVIRPEALWKMYAMEIDQEEIDLQKELDTLIS